MRQWGWDIVCGLSDRPSISLMAMPKKMNDWYKALSDFMIAQPQARAYEVAEFFQVSEAWLSQVKNSDAFKQYHQARRDDHFSRISAGVGEKLTAVAETSLDEIQDRLETQRDALPINTLHDISKMALGALGFGGRGGGNVHIHNNGADQRTVIVNDRSALERGRARLAANRQRNDQAIVEQRAEEAGITVDGEAEEVGVEVAVA